MKYVIIAMLLMALVTYLPRVLPISIFNKEIKSKRFRAFLNYIPYAVLGALTFPDIFYSTSTLVSAIAGTITALVLSYFERSLVVVAVCSIIVVYAAELML